MNKRTRGNRPIEAFQFNQRDNSPLAPRAIKPIEDNIERTPEYLSFMKSLEDFHKSHG
ncbi:hypothetical protein RirG_061180 [Rhizophagus irregularis DAOM 197198w]|nr:hypothetical protein RirG_061180 [Rhizophagus irregularis DAOM 197198w]